MKPGPKRRKTWRKDVVLGVLSGVACFTLVARFWFLFMIGHDNARLKRLVLSEMLIVSLILFLLRYIDNRLQRISTITTTAVVTFGLLPFVLIALFGILLALFGGIGD